MKTAIKSWLLLSLLFLSPSSSLWAADINITNVSQVTTMADTDLVSVVVDNASKFRLISWANLSTALGLARSNYTIIATNYYITAQMWFTNNLYVSNAYVTNILTVTEVSNFFSTNLVFEYPTNYYFTNYVYNDTFTSNYFTTNLFTDNYFSNYFFYTNYVTAAYTNYTTNTYYLIDVDTLTITNGLTNLWLTPSTVLQADATRRIASMTNGAGALTNNGSGVLGWTPIWYSWDWTTITNIDTVQIPWAAVTNPPTIPDAQTNISWTGVTNIESVQIPWAAITNQPETSAATWTNDGTAIAPIGDLLVQGQGFVDTSGPSNSTDVAVSGPDGRLIWTNMPTVVELNVQSNVVVKGTLYVYNLIVTNTTFYATNLWAGPTNSVDLSKRRQRFVLADAVNCAITNMTGVQAGFNSSTVLELRNASGGNQTCYLTCDTTGTGDGARSYVLTNGVTTIFSIDCTPGVETNFVVRPLW